jgi:hypothetical protein
MCGNILKRKMHIVMESAWQYVEQGWYTEDVGWC